MGEIKPSVIVTRVLSEGWHGQKAQEENRQHRRNAVAQRMSAVLQNHLTKWVGMQTGWQMEENVRLLEFSFLMEATSHGDGDSPAN